MSVSHEEDHGEDAESAQERLTRNWNELLQELRVTQTGVQLMTGFLLTVPFSNRFQELDHTQRTVFLFVFAGSVAATALILAPVAFHRILFRRRQRLWLVEAANHVARAGLLLVAATSCGALFLIFDFVAGAPLSYIVAAIALVAFVVLWAGLPWHASEGARHEAGGPRVSPDGRG